MKTVGILVVRNTRIFVALAILAIAGVLAGIQLSYADPGTYDVEGRTIILDADNDSSISAAVDDVIQIAAGGSNILTVNTSGIVVTGTISGTVTINPVNFGSTGVAATAGNYQILRNNDATNRLQLNAPTGATIELSVNDATEFTLTGSAADFQNNSITTTGNVTIGPISTPLFTITAAGWNTSATMRLVGSVGINTESGAYEFYQTGNAVAKIASITGSDFSDTGNLQFFTRASGGAYTNKLTISQAGVVAIGRAPTGAKLTVRSPNSSTLGIVSGATILLTGEEDVQAIGQLAQIGFGISNTYQPVVIASEVISAAAYTSQDLVFAARAATTDTAPTERLRILGAGSIRFSDSADLNNNNLNNVGNANSDWTSTAFRSAVAAQFDSTLTVLGGGSNPASTGLLRIPNAQSFVWRNAANTADYGLEFTSTNFWDFAGPTTVDIRTRVRATGNGSSPIIEAYAESTATGAADPQFRLTVNGGVSDGTTTHNSYYIGADNSSADALSIGLGTVVGSNKLIEIDPRVNVAGVELINFDYGGITPTIASGAASRVVLAIFGSRTITFTGTTQVTELVRKVDFKDSQLAGDTATLTIDKATTISVTPPSEGTNVILSHTSAIRILNTISTPVNQHGIFIEALTSGATTNSQITLQTGSTPTAASTDVVAIHAVDIAAGDARLVIRSEAGNSVTLGNGTMRATLPAAAAATNVSMNASNELQQDTSSIRFKNNIKPLDFDTTLIYKLDPKNFIWNDLSATPGVKDIGLIAETTYQISPYFVNLNAEYQPWSINWAHINLATLSEVQKHENRINALENTIEILKVRIEALEGAK